MRPDTAIRGFPVPGIGAERATDGALAIGRGRRIAERIGWRRATTDTAITAATGDDKRAGFGGAHQFKIPSAGHFLAG